MLNEALHYVSVTEDEEVIEVELINKLIEGSVRLTKVDAEYPANKLTGAVFELYADTDKDQKLTEKDELVEKSRKSQRHLPDGRSALRRIFCERKDCPGRLQAG